MNYYDLIRSNAVRNHLIDNHIEIPEWKVLSLISFYSKFDSVKNELYKEFLLSVTDERVKLNIEKRIAKYNDTIAFMEADDFEYIYTLSAEYEPVDTETEYIGIFKSFKEAYDYMVQSYIKEKLYSYTISKTTPIINDEDAPKSGSLTYCTREGDTSLSILEIKYYDVDNADKYDEHYFSDIVYIPHPFKIGDRIKPVHWNDIDTSMCVMKEALLWKSDKRYNPEIDFWFYSDTELENQVQKFIDSGEEESIDFLMNTTRYNSKLGIVCQDNEDMCTFLYDLEETKIEPEYHTAYTANEESIEVMEIRVVSDLQNVLRGNIGYLQDLIEGATYIRHYQSLYDLRHFW